MKNKLWKKTLAAIMAFAMIGGAAPVNILGINLLKPALSASAEDTVTYDYNTALGNPVTSGNASYILGDVNGDGRLGLADPLFACQCIHNGVPADRDADYINLVGDVYNTGDGLTDEDFFVLYGWAKASRSYYGAFPVYSFTVNDHGYPENMKETGEYVYTSKSTVKGASITLDGSIGVNFYVELDENVGKAILNGPAGNIVYDSNKLAKAKVQEGDYEGLYKLSYGVNATQASAKVSLEIYYVIDSEQYIQYQLPLCNSNNELYNNYTCEYSVNDYISDSDKYSSDKKLKNLVYMLDMYCKSAENYFCGTNHDVPYRKTRVEDFDPKTGMYRVYGLLTDFLDLKGYTMALVLNSETSIRVFYDGPANTADIEEVGGYYDSLNDKKTENGKSYFEIENIRADKLAS
ncbi:MAG: hypothetical protein GXY08_02050, partial [Ruminococcus sp.]|nr:hypothetical protein [Ruminococcus sp.]